MWLEKAVDQLKQQILQGAEPLKPLHNHWWSAFFLLLPTCVHCSIKSCKCGKKECMVLCLFQRLTVPADLPEPDAVTLHSAILQDGPESSSRWVWWVRGHLISCLKLRG